MKIIFIIILCLLSAVGVWSQEDSLFITTSDSVQIFVQRGGKGYPVLFIHGGPGSHSGYFKYCGGSIFEKDVQMIYMDQRGSGRSMNAANKNYSLQRMVKDFEEVRGALGIKQWIIMPHSFGAILATEYAYRHPESITAIVYLNGTINIDHSAKSGLRRSIEVLKKNNLPYAELTNDSIPLLQRWGMGFQALQEHDLFYRMMFDTKANFNRHDSVTQALAKHNEFAQQVWRYPEYFVDFSPKTKQIKKPVLVISGTRDYTIGLDHPTLMKFPNMQVKYVPGGHALYMEHRPELYDAVRPFLKKWGKSKPQ